MPDKSNRRITISQGGGFFKDISLRLKLILRLMGDSRVNTALKLMPIGSLVYLVLPTDLLPINPIDDQAVPACCAASQNLSAIKPYSD